jgi:Rrf2 family transcriptional regulator, iron-sulfur cluster assembly transcription factor
MGRAPPGRGYRGKCLVDINRMETQMKLSTKGRYAMVAMVDLALILRRTPDRHVSLAEISKRQNVSLAYLEQLFVKLRRAGLVESVRGPGGGYKLARPMADIRVSEVLEAVEETVNALETGAGASGAVSGSQAQSLTNRLWEGLSAQVFVFPPSDHAGRYCGQHPQTLSGGP